jgi:hypothetical protein
MVSRLKTNDLSKVCDVDFKSEFIFGHGYALYYPLDYVSLPKTSSGRIRTKL